MERSTFSHSHNDLSLRFHAVIRDIYEKYADRDICRDLDLRDLAQFEPGHVPDTAPLFSGQIYEALPCIHGEVSLLEGMMQWSLAAASKRPKRSHRPLEQQSGNIHELGAFLLCKEHALAAICPVLCRVMHDMCDSAIYANRSPAALMSVAGFRTSLQKSVERRIGRRRKYLSPSMVEMEVALLALSGGNYGQELSVFVRCLTELRCCMLEAEGCVDNIFIHSAERKNDFQSTLQDLGCLQQALLELSMKVAVVVPTWKYVSHLCLSGY